MNLSNQKDIVVKHKTINQSKRTATFDVDGKSVTRQIADGVGVDELPIHLKALEVGLLVEKAAELAAKPPLV